MKHNLPKVLNPRVSIHPAAEKMVGTAHEHMAPPWGVRVLYEVGDYRLSCVNGEILRAFPFAWEFGVMNRRGLTYDTPLTEDVEIFNTLKESRLFVYEALAWMIHEAGTKTGA